MPKVWARIEVSFTSEHFDHEHVSKELERGLDAMVSALPGFRHMEKPQPLLIWLEVRPGELTLIENKKPPAQDS